MSLVSQKTVANERALAVSARLMGNRFGQFMVPVCAGAIAASTGVSGVFIALSVLLATSLFGASSR